MAAEGLPTFTILPLFWTFCCIFSSLELCIVFKMFNSHSWIFLCFWLLMLPSQLTKISRIGALFQSTWYDCGPLTVQASSWTVLWLEELSLWTLNSLKTRKTYFGAVFFPSLFVFHLFSLLLCFPEINRQSRMSKREKSEFVTIFLDITSGFWGRDLFCFWVWFWGFYLAKDHWSFREKSMSNSCNISED